MITQYVNSNGSSSTDTTVNSVIANKISLLDHYIIMQTGEYEYTALVKGPFEATATKYVVSRGSSGYNYAYTISSSEDEAFEWTVKNEMYVYSNVDVGRSMDLPVYQGVQSHCLMIMCCTLLFAIVFKGVLFKCLERLKRR